MQTYILFFPRIGRNRELKKVLEGIGKENFPKDSSATRWMS